MTTPWDKGGTNLVLNYAVTLCIFLYLYLVSELNTALLPVQFITLSISADHHNCPLTWSLRAMISVYLSMSMRIVEILHAKMR